jgi:hypothetical protein
LLALAGFDLAVASCVPPAFWRLVEEFAQHGFDRRALLTGPGARQPLDRGYVCGKRGLARVIQV